MLLDYTGLANGEIYHLLAREKYDLVICLAYDGTILDDGVGFGENRFKFGSPVD